MNAKYENPDRDIARVMKKESHENTRRDRKQFRNIMKGLRNLNLSDDELYDISQDNYERFGNK